MAYDHATGGRLSSSSKGSFGGVTGPLRRLAEKLALWQQRADTRQELERLLHSSPHLIADVGLTVERARREIAKPVWRP